MNAASNPLRQLPQNGQSIWLDFIERKLLRSGELARLVREDGLLGLTSNPAIFEKAIASGGDYDQSIAELARRALDAAAICESLAVADIRDAADVFAQVHAAGTGADGYVSLEVSPALAHDTAGTLEEARRLWRAVDRPNLMIKVPGTAAGVAALRVLVEEGIHVNVTLLFARAAYEAVAEAWLAGLEARAARGLPVDRVASVASFFVSRIDSAVDARLAGPDTALAGRAAIANARLAYAHFRGLAAGSRFQALAARGARPQRLLWASTSAKNPAYRDVVYVEELVGPHTVNTLPPATLAAFRDHGVVRGDTLLEDEAGQRELLAALGARGIDLGQVTDALLAEGLAQFSQAWERLIAAVELKRKAAGRPS